MTDTKKKHVLIVGGGFGGVKAAVDLTRHTDLDITLISDKPDFRYYPALYHTATGGAHVQSSIPLKQILDTQRVKLVQATAKTVDRAGKKVITADGQSYHYDTLILALGVVTNYFGIEGLEEYSFGIKSWEQIQRFKKHLHQQLMDEGKPDLNYLIVGAGPTGIELAGELPGYLRKIMQKHGIKNRKVSIEIIEALPRLLPHSKERISRAVAKRLKKMGIKLLLGQAVQGQTADHLMVNGKPIKSKTVIWTAGTSNTPFFKENNFALNERGKVVVDDHLRAEKDIFVIGDNAATKYSGLALSAVRDGRYVARVLAHEADGKTMHAYQPWIPIPVIPVGKNWAAVEWGKFSVTGMIGALLRSAADWVGYHDIQPWWKATLQWMTEFEAEPEDCPVCSPKEVV